jgi:hypothetical protein
MVFLQRDFSISMAYCEKDDSGNLELKNMLKKLAFQLKK